MSKSILFWRRINVVGLERLELVVEPDHISATSTVICPEAGGFRLDHSWRLSPDWPAQARHGGTMEQSRPWPLGTRARGRGLAG